MRPRFLLHRFADSLTRRRYDDRDHFIEFRTICSVFPTLLPPYIRSDSVSIRKQGPKPCLKLLFMWCRRRDSNPHALIEQRILSPLRLPFRHSGIDALYLSRVYHLTTDHATHPSGTHV